MHWTKQVVDSLDRIECQEIDINEYRIPVGHSAIPKSWQLKSLEFLAILRLVRDESSLWIYILKKVEWLTVLILHSTNEINWIEVSALLEHCDIIGIVLINLARFKNLELIGSVW